MINGANLKVQTKRVKTTQTNFTGSIIKEEDTRTGFMSGVSKKKLLSNELPDKTNKKNS